MRRVAVGFAAGMTAAVLGTVPAVGGYSNTLNRQSEFTTVGIVSRVEGTVFATKKHHAKPEAYRPGHGVSVGDKIWVEPGSRAEIVDTKGNLVAVAGPALVEFVKQGKLTLYRGAVKLRSALGEVMQFHTVYAEGNVFGEAAVWSSNERTQVLGLDGEVLAWHPRLMSSPVRVGADQFAESIRSQPHLNLTEPRLADSKEIQVFLDKFGAREPRREVRAWRTLASTGHKEHGKQRPAQVEKHSQHVVASDRGSRKPSEVVEPVNEEVLEKLEARISGEALESDPDGALNVAGPREAVVRHPRGGNRKLAAEYDGTGFEIVREGKDLGEEEKRFLKKMKKGQH
ncbi:MAG: hypothetical protein AB1540_11970 [Bdellovibrionota bacterium]